MILMMGVTQQESVVVKEMGQAATFVTYAVCLGFIRKLRSPPVSLGGGDSSVVRAPDS